MVLLQFYAIIIINFIKADIMKDNKKNKGSDFFAWCVIGVLAVIAYNVYQDHHLTKKQTDAQIAQDAEIGMYYYYNFMQ